MEPILMAFRQRWSVHRSRRSTIFACFFLSIFFNCYFLIQRTRTPVVEDHDRLPVEVNFLPILNATQASILDETLRIFDEAMRIANISYFIIDGSVIGSYRHHGRIPWDGDIDVMVNVSDEQRVTKALTDFHPDFGLYVYITAGLWKFYSRLGDPIVGYPHSYPFLDIFFYFETPSHIVRTTPFIPRARYRKDHVFPLRPRPFGDLMVPVPCDPVGFLEDIGINVTNCLTTNNKYDSPVEVVCERLTDTFPFVQRFHNSSDIDMVEEILMVGGRTLQKVHLHSRSRCNGKLS